MNPEMGSSGEWTNEWNGWVSDELTNEIQSLADELREAEMGDTQPPEELRELPGLLGTARDLGLLHHEFEFELTQAATEI